MSVIFFLILGDSPASEFYILTFFFHPYATYEDGTEYCETSGYKIQTSGNHQRERISTFRIRRKFEIKEYN